MDAQLVRDKHKKYLFPCVSNYYQEPTGAFKTGQIPGFKIVEIHETEKYARKQLALLANEKAAKSPLNKNTYFLN